MEKRPASPAPSLQNRVSHSTLPDHQLITLNHAIINRRARFPLRGTRSLHTSVTKRKSMFVGRQKKTSPENAMWLCGPWELKECQQPLHDVGRKLPSMGDSREKFWTGEDILNKGYMR